MSTFTNQSKNSTSFSDLIKGNEQASLWASNVLPWQLALPWQFIATSITSFSNQTKN